MSLLPFAILAGGLATRLRPLTDTMPKSLVPVAGEPFLAHQLRLLRRRGARRVVLCLGHLGEAIRDFAGDGERFGLEIACSFDGPHPLGTAGAIRQALPLLGGEFFVLYGDSLLPCDYAAVQEAFRAAKEPALMTVFENRGAGDRSNIEFRDGRIVAYDKRAPNPRMRHIDYGLGVFRSSVFAALPPAQATDLADVYQDLLRRNHLAAFPVDQRFYEVGSRAGIEETSKYLSSHG